ncbi:MAG: lytic transglycosylase domain-containing protein [Salinarimonadaceae bacterium]|nr:MAG: lytic transglycosylase domain-containing protein [Salinarimonadaceae bacterium]
MMEGKGALRGGIAHGRREHVVAFVGALALALVVAAPIARGEVIYGPPSFEDVHPGVDRAAFTEALARYRAGAMAEGDAAREGVNDEAARILLEWTGLRAGGAAAFGRVASFMRDYPDWPGRSLLRLRAEQALVREAGIPDATILAFFAAEKPRKGAGALALAGALAREGNEAAARDLTRDLWLNGSLSETLEARVLAAYPGLLSSADHRRRMERLAFEQDWAGARRAAQLAGEGYETLVAARRALGGPPAGLQRALDAVPERLRSDSSYLYTLARRARLANETLEAAAIIRRAPRALSIIADGDAWWTERRIVARNVLELGDAELAYELVSGHAAQSPAEVIDAEFHAGWIALRDLGDPEKALAHFERAGAPATTPISLSRAAFWRARAHEAAGREAEALAAFEEAGAHATTYYGQLALQRLGREIALRPLPEAGPDLIARRDAAPLGRAIRLLHHAGAGDLAIALLGDLGRTNDDAALIRAYGDLAEELGDARGALALARSALLRGLPLDAQAYPLGAVPDYPALGSGVERALVYAIARQESAFDPNAVSPAGARGLMQFMPATARRTAERHGVPYAESRLLGDPLYSAKLGAAHLGDLMDDWGGSAALAFAAYNAGPGHVRRWIERFGDPRSDEVDMIDWVEKIPFPETRSYVQRVMENLVVYRHRLGAGANLAIEADLRGGRILR